MKEALRWIVRRDTEATGTLFGGWLNRFDDVVAVILGVKYGIATGIIVLFALHGIKIVAGYIDLKYVRATRYRNNYISEKAPNNVRVLRRQASS